jgi:N-acetylglucosamine-6-sulfatase
LLASANSPSRAGASAAVGSTAAPAASAERPNIVLVLTDDQDAASISYMPRLKAHLIDRGTSFGNYFVGVSLCCPSRASILRGQYAHNHQIWLNGGPSGGFRAFQARGHEDSTVATWLQAAGYRTAYAGKYLNGYRKALNSGSGINPLHVPPGWDEWYALVGERDFDYMLNENGNLVAYGARPEDYLGDVLAGKATDSIRRAVSDTRPFFLHVAVSAPHAPSTPAPRHRDALPDLTPPRPPSFDEADVGDKPQFVRHRPNLDARTIAAIDQQYRKRVQSLLAVDEMIESIVETLRAAGALENTYIVFTSDNGYHSGEHRLPEGKETVYDETTRVPLILRGPGVPAGRVLDSLALNSDLAPTFAELAGALVPEFVDGRSLVPVLRGDPPADWRRAVLIQFYAPERRKKPSYHALRTRDYLYVEYTSGERELYDVRADPYQLESLHATADAAVAGQLARWLGTLRTCVGASCRAAESGAP